MRGALGFAFLLAACGGDEFSSGNTGGSGGTSKGGTGGSVSTGGTGATPSGGNAGSGGAPDGGVGGVGGAAGSTGGGCGRCAPSEPLCCDGQCLGIDGIWTVKSRACDGNSVFDSSTEEKWKFENGTLTVISSDADCTATYSGTYSFVPPKQFQVTYSGLACTPSGCALGADPNTCFDAPLSVTVSGEVELDCSTAKVTIANSEVCGGSGTLVVGFMR